MKEKVKEIICIIFELDKEKALVKDIKEINESYNNYQIKKKQIYQMKPEERLKALQ